LIYRSIQAIPVTTIGKQLILAMRYVVCGAFLLVAYRHKEATPTLCCLTKNTRYTLLYYFFKLCRGFPKHCTYIHVTLLCNYKKCFTIALYLLAENFNGEHENTAKQNKNFPKLPELYVVLQKINVSKEKTQTIKTNKSSKKRCKRI